MRRERIPMPFIVAIVLTIASYSFVFERSAEAQLQPYKISTPSDNVRSADFSPDGRFIAVGIHGAEQEGTEHKYTAGIAIWDLNAHKIVARSLFDTTADRHEFWPIAPKFLHYTPDGQRLVLFERNAVKILEVASLKEISTIDLGLPIHPASPGQPTPFVVDMTAAGDKVAVLITYLPTYRSGKLRVYDLDTKQMTWEWSFDEDVNGYSLAFSPDTTKIAVAMPQARRGSQLIVLDVSSNRLALHLNDKGDTPTRAVFANKGELLTVSEWQFLDLRRGSIKLWDINTGKLTREITASPGGVHLSVDISRDGRYLLGYVGLSKKNEYFIDPVNQRFRIWELPSERVIVTSPDLAPNNPELPELKISPDGKMVVVYWPISGFAEVFQVPSPSE